MLNYSCRNWLSVSISGNSVTVTALSANPDIVAREGNVHIIVGEKGVTAEADVSVVQEMTDTPTLSLSASEVSIGNAVGSTASVDVVTNQSPLAATVETAARGWLSAEIEGNSVVVTAIGAGVAVWGIINLLEGYGNDNPGAKSQGIKQLMAGGGIVIIAQTVIPQLTTLFS